MPKSALLVMDVQRDSVDPANNGSRYLPRLRRAVDAARPVGIRRDQPSDLSQRYAVGWV